MIRFNNDKHLLLTEEDFISTVLSLFNTGSVALPAALDDTQAEFSEGYIILLQVDVNGLHPSDARRIQFLNRFVLVTIEDNDSKEFHWVP